MPSPYRTVLQERMRRELPVRLSRAYFPVRCREHPAYMKAL